MDEFYHGDETEKLLVAAAYRAADSLLRSLKYMLPAVGHELMALLTVDSLWGLCLLAAGWFLTSIVSGPIGIGINVAFLAYGLYTSWDSIEQTYTQLKDWFWGFYEARTEDDLEAAGQHFATGFAKGGVFIGELLVTHKAVKFASGKLAKRFPPPEKLKQRFEDERKRAAERKENKGESDPIKEGERRQAEATARERKTMAKLQELQRTMQQHGGFELGKDVAQKIPDADTASTALIIGLCVAGTAALVAVAVAASDDDKKGRSR